MDISTAYKTLDIPMNTPPREIKAAYLNLVEVWHPDRFVGKPELYSQATEKLKTLNVAYETIKRHSSFRVKLNRQASKAAPPPKNPFVLVRCVHCTALNRVVGFRKGLVCGRCGSPLIRTGKADMHRPGGRIPCADDACQGVIGFDGRCTLCGHTLKESSEFFGQSPVYATVFNPAKMGAALFMALVLVLCLVSSTSILSSANAHRLKEPPSRAAIKPLSNPGQYRPASEMDYYSFLQKDFIGNSPMDPAIAKEFQRRLLELGYYHYRVDGRLGPQSYSAMRSFLFDFRPPASKLTLKGLLRTLSVHASLARSNSDWTRLHRSGIWQVWLKQLDGPKRDRAYQAMASDNVARIQALIYEYRRAAGQSAKQG
jgi:ribosomal protein S27E